MRVGDARDLPRHQRHGHLHGALPIRYPCTSYRDQFLMSHTWGQRQRNSFIWNGKNPMMWIASPADRAGPVTIDRDLPIVER